MTIIWKAIIMMAFSFKCFILKFLELMTLEQLLWVLNTKWGNDITINLITKPEMLAKSRKTWLKNPYLNSLEKYQKINCKYIFNYEEEVNKQRVLEWKMPDFKAEPWIVWKIIQRDPTILETKSWNLLLQLMVIKRIEVVYKFNWAIISEAQLEQYLKQTKKSNPKQWLEYEIEIINPKLESIVSIE